MISIEEEFKLLKEYLDIKIQLLEYVVELGGRKLYKSYLPTFEYFKLNYKKMTSPSLQEAKRMYENGTIANEYCGGLYVRKNTIANRFSKTWLNCKYYTNGNITGNYTFVDANIKSNLTQILNNQFNISCK